MMSVNSIPGQTNQSITDRVFVGLGYSIVGNSDQAYVGGDSRIQNNTGQFAIANPDGSVSIVGQPVSNLQGTVAGLPMGTMAMGVAAIAAVWFALKKFKVL